LPSLYISYGDAVIIARLFFYLQTVYQLEQLDAETRDSTLQQILDTANEISDYIQAFFDDDSTGGSGTDAGTGGTGTDPGAGTGGSKKKKPFKKPAKKAPKIQI
jgi:hypothetical protein